MSFKATVLTLFPEMFPGPLGISLAGRALEQGIWSLEARDIRASATDRHRTVDDHPAGGGAGMVLKAGPIFDTVEKEQPPRPLLLLGPGGRPLDQACAQELANCGGFSLLCGRYEGIDHRVRKHLVDDELSIGDFVLSGGEVAAMVVMEAVGRLIPGVMGNADSAQEESFSSGLLEHPQYTRPAEFRDMVVPAVLLSGDHARVGRWREAQALWKTQLVRPDLIQARGGLSEHERLLMNEFESEAEGLPRWAAEESD